MPPTEFDKSDTSTIVSCPHCAQPVPWKPTSAFRPFCSRRCRLIDLGEWFNEERRIPGEDADADELDDQEFGQPPHS